MSEELSRLLREHLKSHPAAQLRDAVKFIYQNEFGGGHLITDPAAAFARLEAELAACAPSDEPLWEPLGNGLARLNLYPAAKRLSAATIFKMFEYSSRKHFGSAESFEKKLSLLDGVDDGGFLAQYRDEGCPSLSHSEEYRSAHVPHYRVISEVFVRFFDIFAAIDCLLADRLPITLGIDGMCASGKSTLAKLLGEIYDANVFHADDFFLPPDMRTEERFGEVGGNMHRERLLEEVLIPLSENRAVTFRPFYCGSQILLPPVSYPEKAINIVEGSYSLHPDLRSFYTLTAVLKTDSGTQLARIKERDPHLTDMFTARWIPMENRYFDTFGIFQNADMVFET